METEFIDWTSVVLCVVALIVILKVVLVMHAMSELRSNDAPLGSVIKSLLCKGRLVASYRKTRRLYLKDFNFLRGFKRSWKIQLILSPFWILAADKGFFFEFAMVFGSAMLTALVFGVRFSVSEVESRVFKNTVLP